MLQSRAQCGGTTPGLKVDGPGIVRARARTGVSEVAIGEISSRDRDVVRWVLSLLILRDIPHREIVRREIVHGEVVLSIVAPGSGSSLRELSSAALPFNLGRCTTVWHVSSWLESRSDESGGRSAR
jgi:hypothetical protein